MSKLSEERLCELREWRADDWFADNPNGRDVNEAVDELLSHIDALQDEVELVLPALCEHETHEAIHAAGLCDEIRLERDALQAELAEARAGGAHSCHANCSNPACKIRRERDSLRAELAQTRALLAVRTEALEQINATRGGFDDETLSESFKAGSIQGMKILADYAKNALASNGTEELAAIKGAMDELGEQSCDCEEVNYKVLTCGRCQALAGLKKYFGGGEE